MKSPLSTNERVEIGIFRFFHQFSKIWRSRKKYKVERIGDRMDPWLTPTLIQKVREEKLFQK